MRVPPPPLPAGLAEALAGEPELRPERLEAGRRRLARGPVEPLLLAGLVLGEAVLGAARGSRPAG